MSAAGSITLDAVPRLAPGVRLVDDRARGGWVVLAPERVFVPDSVAAEVLTRVDGRTSVAEIVERLTESFDAERDEIANDVCELLATLLAKRVLEL